MAGYTAKEVQAALDYDPATGALTWRCLPPSGFESHKAFTVWGSKYPGKLALTAKNKNGYLTGKFKGKFLSAHRAAYACMLGRWPDDLIDHIDGNKENNKWENLRPVTRAENNANRARMANNTSGAVGVHWDKKCDRWVSKIRGSVIGFHKSWADAVTARKLAAALDGGFTQRHGV